MNIDLGLLGYIPLPMMPFDKVQPLPNNKQRIVAESHKSVDTKAEDYKYEIAYAYHPHNQSKYETGQIVDFVVA
jgi:hypothetical protein